MVSGAGQPFFRAAKRWVSGPTGRGQRRDQYQPLRERKAEALQAEP
jgi:hypothetical protein